MDYARALMFRERSLEQSEYITKMLCGDNPPPELREMHEAEKLALVALEKQIAKPCKAVKREYSHSDYYCPVCGKQQKNTYKTRREGCFCERCGQRLTLPEPGPKNSEVTTYEFTFG